MRRYRRTSSPTTMLEDLQWNSLQARRKSARLTMLYKIKHNIVYTEGLRGKLQPAPTRARRSHDRQLVRPVCKTLYRKASFLPRTISDWNLLPQVAVEASTIDTFVSMVSERMWQPKTLAGGLDPWPPISDRIINEMIVVASTGRGRGSWIWFWKRSKSKIIPSYLRNCSLAYVITWMANLHRCTLALLQHTVRQIQTWSAVASGATQSSPRHSRPDAPSEKRKSTVVCPVRKSAVMDGQAKHTTIAVSEAW